MDRHRHVDDTRGSDGSGANSDDTLLAELRTALGAGTRCRAVERAIEIPRTVAPDRSAAGSPDGELAPTAVGSEPPAP